MPHTAALTSPQTLTFDEVWPLLGRAAEADGMLPGCCVVENTTDRRLDMLRAFADEANAAGVLLVIAEQTPRDHQRLPGLPERRALSEFAKCMTEHQPALLVLPHIEMPLPAFLRAAEQATHCPEVRLLVGANTLCGSTFEPTLTPHHFPLLWHEGSMHGLGLRFEQPQL